MSKINRRARKDVTALFMSDLEVELQEDSIMQFSVYIDGPDDTPYADGRFKLHATLPENYPYKSPSVGFTTRILHPNVDLRSGSICLDVLNSRWTPVSDLLSVFTQFLPQLLRYPNPSDPLNGEAAQLMLSDPATYNTRVRDAVQQFALPRASAAASSPQASSSPSAGGGAGGHQQGGSEHTSSKSADLAFGQSGTEDADGDVALSSGHSAGFGVESPQAQFDFDGVDLATMDGASCVSDMSSYSAGEL